MASREEYSQWLRDWEAAHPGQRAPDVGERDAEERMPRAIARRALQLVQTFTFPVYAHLEDVIHEDESSEPLDRGQLYGRWQRWWVGLIQRYRLASLLPPEVEGPR